MGPLRSPNREVVPRARAVRGVHVKLCASHPVVLACAPAPCPLATADPSDPSLASARAGVLAGVPAGVPSGDLFFPFIPCHCLGWCPGWVTRLVSRSLSSECPLFVLSLSCPFKVILS